MDIISRQAAADMLQVSTRTLDRYVRQKKITAVRRGRNIEFMMHEIQQLQGDLKHAPTFMEKTKARTIRKVMDGEGEGEVYKKLYHDTKEELRKKQELLQGANYRVGQLEAKLQTMVPLLEYKKEREEKGKLQKAVQDKEQLCTVLMNNVRIERFNRNIFLALFAATIGLGIIYGLIQLVLAY